MWIHGGYQAIAQDVQALQYASLEFSNQRCILDAVTEDGELLRYCNLRMRSKRDIAAAALLSRQSAAQFLPPHLQNDVEIFGEAVKVNPSTDASRVARLATRPSLVALFTLGSAL